MPAEEKLARAVLVAEAEAVGLAIEVSVVEDVSAELAVVLSITELEPA